MKLPLLSLKTLATALVLTLAPFAFGCAGEEAEAQEAQFPVQNVGSDSTTEYAQAQAQTAESTGNPAQAQPIEGSEEVEIGAQPEQVSVDAADDSAEYTDTDPSALTDFHQTLDPYGTWVDDDSYGTVWVPSETVVGADFTPYMTAGHWTYDDDYVWVSDYSWGWAPFHYGRWVYIGGRGWGWVPGREYAGAWVSWRMGYDDWGYVGWAPMPPTWYWRGGYAYGLGRVPYASYTFCASGDLFHPVVATRVVRGAQVGVVAGHTRPYVPAHPVGGGAAGRIAAHPGVGGPSPGMLHIPANAVAHAPATNPGLSQARAFARPSTAASLGGRPPMQALSRSPSRPVAGNFGRSGPSVPGYGRAPAQGYHPYSPGTRSFGGGYSGARPSNPYSGGYHPSMPSYGPRTYGTTPSYHPQYPTFHSGSPTTTPSRRGRGRSYSSPSTPGPTYHSGGGYRGGYHGGFHGGGGGGFHGGGGGHHR